MEVKNICNKCGEVNILDSSRLIKECVHDEYGNRYYIMYYKCKRCNEIEVVQIDTTYTKELYRKLKDLIVKCAKKNLNHETISPKDIKKKDKLMKKIQKEREELKELCNGKNFYNENEKFIVKYLTNLEDVV